MANAIRALKPKYTASPRGVCNADVLTEALLRVADGDRDAFEEVYRRTAAKLFGLCLQILPSRAVAEETLQDVDIVIWRRANLFDAQRGTAMTWLITIARNRAIDQRRRSKLMMSTPIDCASAVPDPRPLAFELIAAEDEHRKMHRCLDHLSTRDASALKAAFLGGSTYADLAQAACLPVGTIKSRMRRALLKLRNGMADA